MTDLTEIRGHHLRHFHVIALLGPDNPNILNYIAPHEGTTLDYEIATYRRLIESPDSPIKITTSLDFLCNYDCPARNAKCVNEETANVDLRIALEYNLTIGIECKSSDVVKLLRSIPYTGVLGDVIPPIIT